MTALENGIEIPVRADLSGFSNALSDLQDQSRRFGSVFSGTIRSAVTSGKSFEETLKSLALRISNVALSAGLKPLEKATSGLFQTFLGSLGGSVSGGITPFAKGGVVSSPTFFNSGFGSGQSLGVMGEAGAEAIMPLSRGSDGRLGVKLQGASQPVNVVFNISTPDVQGFRKSEAQISTLLARTVGRGRRNL